MNIEHSYFVANNLYFFRFFVAKTIFTIEFMILDQKFVQQRKIFASVKMYWLLIINQNCLTDEINDETKVLFSIIFLTNLLLIEIIGDCIVILDHFIFLLERRGNATG